MDPNPNLSRTVVCMYRNVDGEMDFRIGPPRSHGVSFSRPEIPPRVDLLEIGPEWRRSRRPRDRDAEAETARETENLGAWGGESGRGPARVGENPGCRGGGGAAEFQKSSFSKKRTLGNLHWGSVVHPKETLMRMQSNNHSLRVEFSKRMRVSFGWFSAACLENLRVIFSR